MKRLISCLIFIIILGSLLIRTYGAGRNEMWVWVGNGISICVKAPDEVKAGDTVQIEISFSIYRSVQIKYFIIEVWQGRQSILVDELYSKTLWQNQKLETGFNYAETISVRTKKERSEWSSYGSSQLIIQIKAEYDEIRYEYGYGYLYWQGYCPVLDIVVSVVRDIPYDELRSEYESLKTDYSTISGQYKTLQNSLNEAYRKISSLEDEKNVLTGGVFVAGMVAIIEAVVILILLFKRRTLPPPPP